MSERQSAARTPPGGQALALVALFAGPGVAVLYERGSLLSGSSATLSSIVPVVLVATVALFVGLSEARRRPRWLGLLVVMANGPIALLYGFLLVFFGLGGSR